MASQAGFTPAQPGPAAPKSTSGAPKSATASKSKMSHGGGGGGPNLSAAVQTVNQEVHEVVSALEHVANTVKEGAAQVIQLCHADNGFVFSLGLAVATIVGVNYYHRYYNT